MNKILTVFLVGLVSLGSGTQTASAWWPWDALFSNHDCCGHVRWRQYNAFSPFCCEMADGYYPMTGMGSAGSPACSFADGQGYLGELPTPGTVSGPTTNVPTTVLPNQGTPPLSPLPSSSTNTQAAIPSLPAPTWPAWGPGMMNPAAMPGWGPGMMNPMMMPPAGAGVTNSGPMPGIGGLPYPPGFMGSCPTNGWGRY